MSLDNQGVRVADVVKASALVVEIVAECVRVPAEAATKMSVGRPPGQKVAQ